MTTPIEKLKKKVAISEKDCYVCSWDISDWLFDYIELLEQVVAAADLADGSCGCSTPEEIETSRQLAIIQKYRCDNGWNDDNDKY